MKSKELLKFILWIADNTNVKYEDFEEILLEWATEDRELMTDLFVIAWHLNDFDNILALIKEFNDDWQSLYDLYEQKRPDIIEKYNKEKGDFFGDDIDRL